MNRRDFLRTSCAALTLSNMPRYLEPLADTHKRVGLIGSGGMASCDLFRLMQVAPVEVVSLCDVDSRMLADAATQVAARQASKKPPRTFRDYREMLAQKDLDIVLIATPDHWHALPMIEAVEGRRRRLRAEADQRRRHRRPGDAGRGAQVQARRAGGHAAPQHAASGRPRAIASSARASSERWRTSRSTATTTCARRRTRPTQAAPEWLDYEMWTGPAPMRPYNKLVHPRSWRAFMEYGNGIVGDMCVHMLDMVRWMLDLGMPTRVSSTGGILVDKASKANITDTQAATFDFGDLKVVWTHRSWGDPPDPKYPWGATIYGDKGTLKASVYSYDFIPVGGGTPVHEDVALRARAVPRGQDRKGPREARGAGDPRAHEEPAAVHRRRARSRSSDIEQGYISTTACILANLSQKLGRSLAWDHQRGQVVGDDEANRLLMRPYRAPWQHPDPASV